MMPTSPATKRLVDRLSSVLDDEIALLELRRRQLEAMTACVVNRDDPALERLLKEMEQTRDVQASADSRLRQAREELAAAFGLDPSQFRLGGLIDRLPESDRHRLVERRRRVAGLVQTVRKQHLRAAVLVAECARVNRRLMEALMPRTAALTTYGAGGSDSWRADSGLVSTES